MRQIILDTETTGIDPKKGHRIIEIGAVEVIDRRVTGSYYHQYIHPEREVEKEAINVHGITNEFLKDKPVFSAIVDEFMAFVTGAELIIHNAPFDVGFINHELNLLKPNTRGIIEDYCKITDTLKMARRMYPGQRASLDALCKRLMVDNSNRTLHGALLDAEILADVYLLMTGGQVSLSLKNQQDAASAAAQTRLTNPAEAQTQLRIITPSDEELAAHRDYLTQLAKETNTEIRW
ncbi:DNA polymerase III subunit epsilon [Thiomicrospira cyclica]|uniref:DNA polymerase III subunit epsilon n=1 Tax=Thiomicrospira cyclica (strain DSM 14477 / JCM 11371 / ALM1) TaxID=717773 RepID=F6DBU7_THICA|nr:DNA polymerase III subunit epsilon [Thiomicrospira cyclica]AEG31333.1 DNA polymerase III, epsilon subunit [Thiomicrospira cyclica ALM1]